MQQGFFYSTQKKLQISRSNLFSLQSLYPLLFSVIKQFLSFYWEKND